MMWIEWLSMCNVVPCKPHTCSSQWHGETASGRKINNKITIKYYCTFIHQICEKCQWENTPVDYTACWFMISNLKLLTSSMEQQVANRKTTIQVIIYLLTFIFSTSAVLQYKSLRVKMSALLHVYHFLDCTMKQGTREKKGLTWM